MNWKITNEEYIQRAKSVHGDRYRYELTEYVDRNTKITVTCKVHGPFLVNPYTHIRLGCGCMKCANDKMKKTCALTTESFIARAKEYIGYHYDYSKVEYVNAHTPVTIGCPTHGWFTKYPMEIQQGRRGCPTCGKEAGYKKRQTGLQAFIERSKAIHGDKYSYDKVVYKNQQSRVTITCPIHGDFKQIAQGHLIGHGCPKCNNEYYKGRTREDLLKDFYEMHRGFYSYPNLPEWSNNKERVKIICPKHGVFTQSVANHLRGDGCPSCKNSRQENIVFRNLQDKRIRFEREKTFKWLKRKGHMYLDFYLPDFNVAIECHGAMHFGISVPAKYTYTKADYEDIRVRDELKYKLCKEHGIRILYFCYNKEWIPDKYIDKVYSTIKELIEEIRKTKPP